MGHAMITGVAHVALTVRDLATSVAWYNMVLELPLIAEINEGAATHRKTILGNGVIRLGLVEHSRRTCHAFDETIIGLDHLAFAVPRESLERWSERLDELAIAHSPIAPSSLRPDQRVLVFRDPDNIQLEFFED